MHVWAVALAVVLILVILWDAFETIILSRRVSRKFRLTRLFYRLLWTPWRAAAKRVPEGNRRENVLMVFGPASLILLLVAWAVGLIVSFALLHWGLGSQLSGPEGLTGFREDLYVSGTNFFTLGLGDVTPKTTAARTLTVLEIRNGIRFSRHRDRLCADDLAGVLPPRSEHLHARRSRGLAADRRATAAPAQLRGRRPSRPVLATGSAGRRSCSRATSPSRCSPTSARSTTTSRGWRR